MKGAILLFVVVALAFIGWGYIDKQSRKTIRQTVRQNLAALIGAAIVVAALIAFSLNTSITLI